jgi:hypothetical protein
MKSFVLYRSKIRFGLFPHAKCLDTLDSGECCDALFSLQSRYWLSIDEC